MIKLILKRNVNVKGNNKRVSILNIKLINVVLFVPSFIIIKLINVVIFVLCSNVNK